MNGSDPSSDGTGESWTMLSPRDADGSRDADGYWNMRPVGSVSYVSLISHIRPLTERVSSTSVSVLCLR